jgi:hypothetical protein
MSDPSFVRPTRGGGGGAVVALAGALILAMLGLVATPSTGADPCVTEVAAADHADDAAAQVALIAALSAAAATSSGSCSQLIIRLHGTFRLTESLVWADARPLSLVGPSGSMARLEAVVAPGQTEVTHRILDADTAALVTLERLVLTGGDRSKASSTPVGNDQGGAVIADDLRLVDVELIGNEAVSGGAVSVIDLVAIRTSFVRNVAAFGSGEGGAVFALGDVTLENVTFVGNSASEGGAIWMDETGALDATFVTFRDNSAGSLLGGADVHRGIELGGDASSVMLRGVLFGGVAQDSVTPPDSVGPSCGGQVLSSPSVLTWTDSLATDASCGAPVADVIARPAFTTVPFRTGTTDLPVPTGDWPGRDAVTCPASGLPTTDQRGVTRPQGDACDVGSVERIVTQVLSPPPSPQTPEDTGSEAATAVPPVPTSVPAGGGACADGCPAPGER